MSLRNFNISKDAPGNGKTQNSVGAVYLQLFREIGFFAAFYICGDAVVIFNDSKQPRNDLEFYTLCSGCKYSLRIPTAEIVAGVYKIAYPIVRNSAAAFPAVSPV